MQAPRKMGPTATGLLAAGLLVACSATEDADTVATFDGGQVTLGELDQAVLAIPPEERPSGDELLPWFRQAARQLAADQLLLAEARQAGLQPPWDEAEMRRRLAIEAFLDRLPVQPIDEAELQQAYLQRPQQSSQPEQRLVRHLFVRHAPDGGTEAARLLLLGLRDQLLAGSDFAELAAERSHSETRHQGGLLGWVRRGDLDGALEEVIFALEAGTPSLPVAVNGGLHLLQVDEIRPPITYGFDELRGTLAAELTAERLRRAAEASLQDAGFSVDGLDDAGRLDLIGDHVLRLGLDRSAEVEQRLLVVSRQALVEGQRRLRLEQLASSEVERLQRYFEDNQRRYLTPLRLRIEVLRVPLSAAGNEHMALLEAARPRLDSGEDNLAGLAALLGGEVELLGWRTLQQLGQMSGRAAQLAPALRAGQHSPPYRFGSSELQVLHLVERREPALQTFVEVRLEVLDDYVALHGQRLWPILENDLLERARYRDWPRRIAAASGLAQAPGSEP